MSNFKMMLFFAVGVLEFGFLDNMRFMLLLLPLVAGIFPRSVLSCDENSKWQQFSLALPYSRSEIVSAKYIMTLVLCGCSALVSGIFYTVATSLKGDFDFHNLAFIVLLGLGTGLLIPSISTPIDLRFGTANGKILSLIWGGLLGGSGGLLMNWFGSDGVVKTSSSGITAYLPFIAAGVILLLYTFSWKLSVKIYEKREF